MPTTTTPKTEPTPIKTEPTPIKTEPEAIKIDPPAPVKQGKIAILWDPSREPGVPGSVAGSTPIRMWSFGVVTGYAEQVIAGRNEPAKVPIFATVELRFVGRNWVDNGLWQQAKARSRSQYEAAIASGRTDAYDAIARLIKAGAIREFEPEATTLMGSLSDYSEEDARDLVTAVYDADVLRAEMKAESRSGLANFIAARIRDLESGDLGGRR